MSTIFMFNNEPKKNNKILIFLKSRYFVMGDPIDMNVDVL